MDWKDVSLGTFKRLKGLDINELDDQIEFASILLGIDVDDMTWMDFCKELRKLDFLKDEVPRTIVRTSYTLNGRRYVTKAALNELTVARYMDFTNQSRTGDLEKILSVVLIPEGKEYGDYDIEEVYRDILTMSIVDVYAVFNFFKAQFIVCVKTMKDFSVRKLRRDKRLRALVSEAMESCCMLDL